MNKRSPQRRGTTARRADVVRAAAPERDLASTPRERGLHLKIAVAAGLFAGLLLSRKLWLSDRVYPLTPILPFLKPIPPPLDQLIYAVLVGTLVAIAIVGRPEKLIALFALLAIVVCLFDQSRWQPWFYQYLLMLVAVGLYYRSRSNPDHKDGHQGLNACRLIIVCTYLWSGLQKVNTNFIDRTFPLFIEPFTRSLPHPLAAIANSFGAIAAFLEIGIGLGLLTYRFRKYAIFGAFGMHAFILLAIGPLGLSYNSVVWPWNIAMCLFVMILFWKRPNLSAREIVWPHGAPFQKIVFLLFAIAPALSFFNIWDNSLSSALYADVRNVAAMFVTNTLAGRLPKELQKAAYPTKQPDTRVINLADWSMNELNVPIYPEPRIYKNLGRYLCSYAAQPSDVKLLIVSQRVLFSADTQTWYSCSTLSK